MASEEQQVRKLVSKYFSAISSLRGVVPSFSWSNLLGDYGEYICINHYGFSPAKTGTKGFDAVDADGNRVQIKTVNTSSRRKNQAGVKLSSKGADHLLVIGVNEDASWDEIYYGPLDKIWRSSYKAMEKQKTISVGRLKQIQLNTHKPYEKVVVTLENGKQIIEETREDVRDRLIRLGRKVPGMSTINQRINRDQWSLDQAFGTKVPPNYADKEYLVVDKGYKWFPEKPTQSWDRKPLVYDIEKRVYISQSHFAKAHSLPNDYVSDHLKLGLKPAEIIEKYRFLKAQKK